MNAQTQSEQPTPQVEATLKYSLLEWKEIWEHVKSIGPADDRKALYSFKCFLHSMISQSERTYYPEVEK